MSPSTDYIVVLAAGRGVRAGGPKALRPLGDRLWWEIQQSRLDRVGLPIVWVVSERVRGGMFGRAAPPQHLAFADETAPMFASVISGMKAIAESSSAAAAPTASASSRGVFILPVDIPAPSPEVFLALAAAFESRPTTHAAVPTFNNTRGHPLYISWPLVRSQILPAAHTPDARLDHLLGPDRIEVPVNDAGILVNLNTPGDFDRWSREEHRRALTPKA